MPTGLRTKQIYEIYILGTPFFLDPLVTYGLNFNAANAGQDDRGLFEGLFFRAGLFKARLS